MNTERRIRWGILSTGHIAGRFAEALAMLPGAEPEAVGSRTAESAEAFAAKYGMARAHGSYEALANDPDVDVIYIGTPHTLHLENAALCMRAGKAVLCEKAFTINAQEAEEMVRVAREERVFLMEAMIPRHVPLVRKALDWIAGGRIGDVRMVKASRCVRGTFAPGVRHREPELGGGALLDVGVYVISFASMVFGKAPVAAVGLAHIGDWGSDEQGAALLKYDGGEIADLTFALQTEGVNEAYILGTDGFIQVHEVFAHPTKISLFVDKKVAEVAEEPIRGGNALVYEAEEVMRCLREGLLESPRMPLEESVEIMRTMDALRKPWGLRYANDGPEIG